MSITVTKTRQIIPVEDMNVASALKQEIARLTRENDFLQKKLANQSSSETQPVSQTNIFNPFKFVIIFPSFKEPSANPPIDPELASARAEIVRLKSQLESTFESDSLEKLQIVQQAVDTLSQELETNKVQAEQEREKLQRDLESREDKLRQIQSNLLLAEKELDKKFQATAAYGNMKKILVQKNNTIKILRQKVSTLGGREADNSDGQDDEGDARIENREVLEEEGFRI